MKEQRTANSVLTVCLTKRDNRILAVRVFGMEKLSRFALNKDRVRAFFQDGLRHSWLLVCCI
jgi:hypothetical protein